MEDVVHCTDCKAHWGYVIVILHYRAKIDGIWFGQILKKEDAKVSWVLVKLKNGWNSMDPPKE